jgi:hypothetical protein
MYSYNVENTTTKKQLDHLHLRHHSVPDQGAFELDLSK